MRVPEFREMRKRRREGDRREFSSSRRQTGMRPDTGGCGQEGRGDIGHPRKGYSISGREAVCDLPESESAKKQKAKTR